MNNELPLDFLAASYGLKSDDADTCDFCGNISGKDNLFAGIEASICVECAGLAKFTIDSLKGKLKTNRRMIMNKYRDKSDFEINKAVAIARGAEPFHNDGFKKSTGYFHKDAVIIKAKFKIGAFDPCSNPADAMPIIKDNLISLEHDGIAWMVSCVRHPEISVWDGCENYNDNFYRKAMELFLLMKDAENEKS